MCGFITSSGSIYYINVKSRIISGGKLGDIWRFYTDAEIIIGNPAIISLEDGRILKTSTVVEYI